MNIYQDFYVYAYLREDGTPYYVGKGRKHRAYYKYARAVKPPVDKKKIVLLERNLTLVGALSLERRMIRWYGRIVDGGVLHNIAEGGEGNPGYKHNEKTIEKLQKKIPWNKGLKTGPQSETTRKNAAEARKGKQRGPYKGKKEYTKAAIRYQNSVMVSAR